MRMESMNLTAQHLQQRRPMMLQLQSRLQVNELMHLFFFFQVSKNVKIKVSANFFFYHLLPD